MISFDTYENIPNEDKVYILFKFNDLYLNIYIFNYYVQVYLLLEIKCIK